MIEVLHETKRVIVVKKPQMMPVCPDPSGDVDLMTHLSAHLRELSAPDKLYLVHRLDRTVGGTVVFARDAKMAGELSALFRDRLMNKDYLAVVHGRIDEGGELVDYLLKTTGVAKIVSESVKGAKRAELSYRPIAVKSEGEKEYTLLRIELGTGRFHQIRAQLSHFGHSIVGDGKYGSHEKRARTALFAYHLAFTLGKEAIEVKALPDCAQFPWSLFAAELEKERTK